MASAGGWERSNVVRSRSFDAEQIKKLKKDLQKAMEAYLEATNLVPDNATNGEAAFWVGVTLADAGKTNEAIPYLKRAFKQDKRWAKLISRLPASGLLPDDKKLISSLINEMKK